jgi:hypothetical protein
VTIGFGIFTVQVYVSFVKALTKSTSITQILIFLALRIIKLILGKAYRKKKALCSKCG